MHVYYNKIFHNVKYFIYSLCMSQLNYQIKLYLKDFKKKIDPKHHCFMAGGIHLNLCQR